MSLGRAHASFWPSKGLGVPSQTRQTYSGINKGEVEARHGNALWQFDLSPSDLKQIEAPSWVEPGRGAPTLMLYSVVDDRSGLCYQEYRCVYGEDVEAALRFLFAAMSPKAEPGLGLEGIPEALYLDNGPIGKSRVFRSVMDQLGVKVMTHMPAGSDGRRPTARAKGKVERAFRTVKEAHETLYHFHKPGSEDGGEPVAAALPRPVQRPAAPRGRPARGWRTGTPACPMPACGRCAAGSATAPSRVSRSGARSAATPGSRSRASSTSSTRSLAGETVVLWWGLFDHDLYAEHREERHGPYRPLGAPVSLERFRRHRKTPPRGEGRAHRCSRAGASACRARR